MGVNQSWSPQRDYSIVFVGQDNAGRHLVHETHGPLGEFADRAAAIACAQAVARAHPGAIVMIAPERVPAHAHA